MSLPLSNGRWVVHPADSLLPYTLLLESDGCVESSGITTSRMSSALGGLTSSLLSLLTGAGDPLDDIELAVHARLHPLLGHGAFAAANVRLLPTHTQVVPTWPVVTVEAASILSGDEAVGIVDDQLCGAPYIALGHGPELTDCLLLTWSGDWGAFRTYLRTDFLRPGTREFEDSLRDHKARVIEILGPAGVIEAMSSGYCVN